MSFRRTVPERALATPAYPAAHVVNSIGGHGFFPGACASLRAPPPTMGSSVRVPPAPVQVMGPTMGARRQTMNLTQPHAGVGAMTPDVMSRSVRTRDAIGGSVRVQAQRDISRISGTASPTPPFQAQHQVSAVSFVDQRPRSPAQVPRFISGGSVTPMPPHQPQQQAQVWIQGSPLGSPKPAPKQVPPRQDKSPTRSPPRAPRSVHSGPRIKSVVAPVLGSPNARHRSPVGSPQATPLTRERGPLDSSRAAFQYVPASSRSQVWEPYLEVKRIASQNGFTCSDHACTRISTERSLCPEHSASPKVQVLVSSPMMSPPKLSRATSGSPPCISRSTTDSSVLGMPRPVSSSDSTAVSSQGLPKNAVHRCLSDGWGASMNQSAFDESEASVVWEPSNKSTLSVQRSNASSRSASSYKPRRKAMNFKLGPSKTSMERRRLRHESDAKDKWAKRQARLNQAGSCRPTPTLLEPQASTIWKRRHDRYRGRWPTRGCNVGLHAMSTQLREILADTVLVMLDDEMADIALSNVALACCNRALLDVVCIKYAPLVGSLRWKVRRALRPDYVRNSGLLLSARVSAREDSDVKLPACIIKVADVAQK